MSGHLDPDCGSKLVASYYGDEAVWRCLRTLAQVQEMRADDARSGGASCGAGKHEVENWFGA